MTYIKAVEIIKNSNIDNLESLEDKELCFLMDAMEEVIYEICELLSNK